MNLLPKDIWYQISLNLPPLHLSILSKAYLNLYDDHWYKCYLEIKYSNIDFGQYNNLNYKEITKKAIKQGDVCEYHYSYSSPKNLKVQGIKVSYIPRLNFIVVLDFLGNLYIHDGDDTIKVDSGVVDIDKEYYSKKHELCQIMYDIMTKNIKITVIDLFDDNITKILAWNQMIYILTNFNEQATIRGYKNGQLVVTKTFTEKIKAFRGLCSDKIIVLFENKCLLEVNGNIEKICLYEYLGEDLHSSIIKVEGNYCMFGVRRYDKLSLRHLLANIGKYIDSATTAYGLYILTDQGLFKLNECFTYEKIYTPYRIKSIFAEGHHQLYQII
jgi:hypothetical protein